MKKFFASFFAKDETKIILLGLDAAGKTTIIYKMKLGEVQTVIPTIGFNLEIVKYKDLNLNCWDVGGCDKIRPLWRHFFDGMQALIFVVDSNDRERIAEAKKELEVFLRELEGNPHPVPVLIFANKQDLPNCMSPAEIADKMDLKSVKNSHIMPSCAISGDGLFEGFDWLNAAVAKYKATVKGNLPANSNSNSNSNSTANSNSNSNSNSTTAPTPNPAPPANGVRPTPQPPFNSPSDTLTNTEFLKAFEEVTLPSWDHKTHIRIAYVNLKRHGRREGVRKIRAGLQNFIANSTITNKNRYHETMTYFWIQMTHYAMSCCKIPLTWEPYDDENGLPEFNAFLEKNVQLMNGGLFLEYYSRDLMLNTQSSREQFAVPDVKPLPNIVETN